MIIDDDGFRKNANIIRLFHSLFKSIKINLPPETVGKEKTSFLPITVNGNEYSRYTYYFFRFSPHESYQLSLFVALMYLNVCNLELSNRMSTSESCW